METYIWVFATLQILGAVINFVHAIITPIPKNKVSSAVHSTLLTLSAIWGYNVLGVFS